MRGKHKKAFDDLSYEFVRRIFDYNSETGLLTWKISCGRSPAGSPAGWMDDQGRIKIGVRNKDYMAHRIIWVWMTKEWPKYEIDHINEQPSDNRWKNLRRATPSQNHRNRGKQRNNTTGFKGVCFDKRRNFYIAGVKLNGKRHSAGNCFKTPQEAYKAVCKLAAKLHGKWSRYT